MIIQCRCEAILGYSCYFLSVVLTDIFQIIWYFPIGPLQLARGSHGTKSAMLESKLRTGTSKTKKMQICLDEVALFWMPQWTACSPAWRILYHVTASCKRPIVSVVLWTLSLRTSFTSGASWKVEVMTWNTWAFYQPDWLPFYLFSKNSCVISPFGVCWQNLLLIFLINFCELNVKLNKLID